MKPTPPDFRSPAFLRDFALQALALHGEQHRDTKGGLGLPPQGQARVAGEPTTHHLAGTTHFISLHAKALLQFPEHAAARTWRDAVTQGLAFLQEVHRDPVHGGYAWTLRWDGNKSQVTEADQYCEGLAWVLHAHALALRAGFPEARKGLDDSFALMERHFWESGPGLYATQARPGWQLLPYRGQKANMHACEALLAAFEATGKSLYLQRAALMADGVTEGLAAQTDGLVWEHYRSSEPGGPWILDPEPQAAPRRHHSGHLARWARLLVMLERAVPEEAEGGQRVHRARELFAAVVGHAWDRQHGGLVQDFTLAPSELDDRKPGWVQAEAIAAAAALAERTAEGHYWDWYDRLWSYCWAQGLAPESGLWPFGLPPDHHDLRHDLIGITQGRFVEACWEALGALTGRPA